MGFQFWIESCPLRDFPRVLLICLHARPRPGRSTAGVPSASLGGRRSEPTRHRIASPSFAPQEPHHRQHVQRRTPLVLEGLEAVRSDPAHRLDGHAGLMHCLWEIIDNGVDEALAGAAQRIEVTLHPTTRPRCTTTAAASPWTRSPRPGCPASRSSSPAARRREVRRRLVQRHRRPARCRRLRRQRACPASTSTGPPAGAAGHVLPAGLPGVFDGEGRGATFEPRSGLTRKGPRVAKGKSGTRVRFWPDRQIFTKDATFVFDELITRARQTSFIVPGLEPDPRPARARAPRGEVPPRRRHRGVHRVPRRGRAGHRHPAAAGHGHLHRDRAAARRQGPHDAAGGRARAARRRRGALGHRLRHRGPVVRERDRDPKGGTHVSGFEQAVTKTFNEAMRATKALKVNDDDVIKDDVLEGLTGVVTVRLAEPQVRGPDQGDPRDPSRAQRRTQGRHRRARKFLTSTKWPRRPRPSWSWRRSSGRSGRGSRRASTRRPSAGRTPSSPPRCPPSSPTAGPPTTTAPSCSSSRVTPRRHRQARPELRVPGAAPDPRQDPERPEGLGRRHAQEHRVCVDHPGGRGRVGADVRPRRRPLRPDHLHGRRGLRRRPHPACSPRCSSSTCPS